MTLVSESDRALAAQLVEKACVSDDRAKKVQCARLAYDLDPGFVQAEVDRMAHCMVTAIGDGEADTVRGLVADLDFWAEMGVVPNVAAA